MVFRFSTYLKGTFCLKAAHFALYFSAQTKKLLRCLNSIATVLLVVICTGLNLFQVRELNVSYYVYDQVLAIHSFTFIIIE